MSDDVLTRADLQRAAGWMYGRAEGLARKLEPIYAALDWTWQENPRPPSADEIEKTLRHLADLMLEAEAGSKEWFAQTGGLIAEVERDDSATDGSYRIHVRLGMEIDEEDWL